MLFLDPTYLIFMIPAFILMIIAQSYVNGAYKKWSKVTSRSNFTGATAAQRLITAGGLDVKVDGVRENSPTTMTHVKKCSTFLRVCITAVPWQHWRSQPMSSDMPCKTAMDTSR